MGQDKRRKTGKQIGIDIWVLEMLLENVRPLLIVWLPITTRQPNASTSNISEATETLEKAPSESSWLDTGVNFVLNRIKEPDKLVGAIPVPFYFYERLSNSKINSDETAGFLLDSVSESISLSYPETPTTGIVGEEKAKVVTVRNTIDVAFRVKLGSTIVSTLKFLLKSALTDYKTARNIRFGFFWRDWVLSVCKIVDYNEAPITGTDLTMLKIKFETFQPNAGSETSQAATVSSINPSAVTYSRP